MEKTYKQKILDYIKKYDPNNEIVLIDEEKKIIKYNDNIVCHNPIKFENEGYIRAYLIVKLVRELDYPVDCIELEKHYNIGSRPVDKSAFLDILVRDKRNKEETYLFIECKSPIEYEAKKVNIQTQLFNMAGIQDTQEGKVKYLIYYTVDESLEDKNIIVDFENYKSYKQWMARKDEEELNVIPEDYGISYHAHYAKVDEEEGKEQGFKKLNNELGRDEFWKLKGKLHNVLWGGGSSNYNDVFYYLMHLFLAKIYDELWRRDGEKYEFQIVFEDGKREPYEKTFERIEKLYRQAQSHLLNQPDDIIEKSTFIDLDKLSLNKVINAVKLIQGISLTENKNESDILGEFFESIISTQFKQDKGQFFTDTNIVRFIIEALDIKDEAIKRLNGQDEVAGLLPYVIDPSCGSGTFLLEVMKIISKFYLDNKDKISVSRPIKNIIQHQLFVEDADEKNKINSWAHQYIYGIEPNIELATATKVNMILHGDGNANIFIKDGLAHFNEYEQPARITLQHSPRLQVERKENMFGMEYPLNEQFDFIVTNPPFSLTFAEDEDQDTYSDRFAYASKKNSENLFIERWYQLLKENGRIGVVLPDSVFDTTENKYIRLFLLKYFRVNAVVSLDKIAFQPYTSTKVSVLFATKRTQNEIKQFEKKWNHYTKKYLKLRNSNLVHSILKNDELFNGKNGLLKLCEKYSTDFNVSQKILDDTVFTSELYTELFNKMIPEELYENWENCGVSLESLETEADVIRYKELAVIPYKEKSKDEKKEFKELKSKKLVQEFLAVDKEFKELDKQVVNNSDVKNLNEIRAFVENNPILNYDYSEGTNILKKYIKDYFPNDLTSLEEIVERSYDEIIEISKQDYPDWETTKAKQHQLGYCNSWWVYGEVSRHFNTNVFYAEAEHLGYKRTKRGRQDRPNELYAVDRLGNIITNTDNPQTILDMIKTEEIWK
ncbi:HsdM family class I SAM-dependent methyltransferase [Metabacillus iocasae]|uniref:Type I restriction enzyme M protein n=1 Tax=Priestia iocasae TaxID=2291674 RepID=A0ABS2QWJ0_9BACI|nr:N-6 DNA methylase [Metabacillus iocasae]MBM7702859.1 type I restriction enzyme M protein [Metabacillus iocasae]